MGSNALFARRKFSPFPISQNKLHQLKHQLFLKTIHFLSSCPKKPNMTSNVTILSASTSRKAAPNSTAAATTTTTTPNVARGRIYRTVVAGQTKWVTRDLAALDFLLGIPMEQEPSLVHAGWLRNQQPAPGKWWEKFIRQAPASVLRKPGDNVLEQPDSQAIDNTHDRTVATGGRRLDGDKAIKVTIPRTGFTRTRQRSIARQAAIREWELQVAHGLQGEKSDGLLDGRVFFSSKENYPISIFSVIRYEPKREEAARLRQKLEARGGGGTQFNVPERDWSEFICLFC